MVLRSLALPLGIVACLALAQPAGASPAPPDLWASALAWTPPSPAAGDTMVFSVHATNAGGSAAAPSTVQFLVDGIGVSSVALDTVPAGASQDVRSAPWAGEVGRHVLRVVLDADDAAGQTNRANDALSRAFFVGPAPLSDLVVGDLALEPRGVVAGDDAAVAAEIRNQGREDAGPFRVSFVVDGEPLEVAQVADLPAGASVTVRSPAWHAVAGTHTVRAVADATDVVQESSEVNNARAERFAIGSSPLPDLVVESIALAPDEPGARDDVVFTARVTNLGRHAARTFEVGWAVDGEGFGRVSVEALAAGASVDVQSPRWDARSGNHSVRVVADVGDVVLESREGNNARSQAFDVPHRGLAGLHLWLDRDEARVTLCHVPAGDPDHAHTLTVDVASLSAHLGHGDDIGACDGDEAGVAIGPRDHPDGHEQHHDAGSAEEAAQGRSDEAPRGGVRAEANVQAHPDAHASASVIFGPAGEAMRQVPEVGAPLALVAMGALALLARRRD
jgi:CARDB protein